MEEMEESVGSKVYSLAMELLALNVSRIIELDDPDERNVRLVELKELLEKHAGMEVSHG